jgi:hypothetical protein
MKPHRNIRVILVSLLALSLLCSGRLPHPSAAPLQGEAENRTLLPTGSVTVLGSANCLPGTANNAVCKSILVSCPGLPDIDATQAVAPPTGTPKGTIILLSGGPGTANFNSGFANAYTADGFQVVQIAWASDWASANGAGVKSAACRPSTFFKYVFETAQRASRTKGFCGQGISGGGGALAYSLAQYGLANFFDYVVIAAGPGVSRMDYGCDTPLYTGPPRNLCPLLPNASFTYGSGKLVNGWENTTTCTAKNPLPQDITRWTADSIVTAGALYSYPKTGMSWFFCVTPPAGGGSTGEGTFLIDQVIPKNAPPDVSCYSGICQSENVWQDPSAFRTTESEMVAQCVPNH